MHRVTRVRMSTETSMEIKVDSLFYLIDVTHPRLDLEDLVKISNIEDFDSVTVNI